MDAPFRAAFEDIGDDDIYNMEFELIGMRDLSNPSEAELMYGSEAWNAYDRGEDVR